MGKSADQHHIPQKNSVSLCADSVLLCGLNANSVGGFVGQIMQQEKAYV